MRANLTLVKGQQEEVGELISRLERYCQFLTRNKWDREEVAQEALAKALNAYKIEDWNAALLKKIAYHVWVDRVRKMEREAQVIHEPIHQPVSEESEDLMGVLAKNLTPKQLVTFVLKEGFQYKISEIAELMGMTEAGVKALLNRARARVKGLSESDIESFWEEELREELFPVLVDAVSMQDPEKLLAMLPAIFTPTASLKKVVSFPSSTVLSLAA
ncbi:sigma factor-like helix-turn-helix DNA-binding protein [Jeotgalibacillus sp. R-1-5s-1]|uniref:sigma factor-like helix-turn-helix DNA-binding protein n=1 Tax=Jeotgalibacillus sp. R-1-5s-1 TaxID=2555897 RepID=UPI00106D75E8|nr:sigma factor-like helix-turn-helix DNA-binding protein [Jeotgalibacillus sp. R-1-5s-1]TFD94533.1 RNA polymerase subunit sigma [Jeotgalibacillus sp. R-1-5s-1]